MSRRIADHIRRNVYGLIAIFIALGGTAYAANTVGSADIIDDSVASVDLKDNDVRGIDVRDNTLGSADIFNGSLRGADLRDDSVTADDLSSNSVGASEIQTDAVQATEVADNSIDGGEIVDNSLGALDLSPGAVRASELGSITRRSAVSAVIPPGGNGSATANCLAGERVVSGGNDGFFDVFVVASRDAGNGWSVFVHNNSGANRTITAHVYCLSV